MFKVNSNRTKRFTMRSVASVGGGYTLEGPIFWNASLGPNRIKLAYIDIDLSAFSPCLPHICYLSVPPEDPEVGPGKVEEALKSWKQSFCEQCDPPADRYILEWLVPSLLHRLFGYIELDLCLDLLLHKGRPVVHSMWELLHAFSR